VDQFDQRMRDVEGDGAAKAAALQQRAKELEDELQQATARHEKIAAQADEQAQAHKMTVEQLEQRVRTMEAESGGNVTALRQRATELEDQLHQVTERHEKEKSIAHQESAGRIADIEQLTLEIRGLEAERDTKEAHLQTLQAHVNELEEQLQQSAGRMTVEKAKVAVNSSEQFLRRAEWITACTVGPILPHGLIAAETYASAALAANPQSAEASQLLAELARIHRAHPEGLPSATEAVTTFDEKAAAFFAGDLSRAADVAEDEANRRARAGMNRSALLTASVALELRQKSDPADGTATARLQELKASLLARAGGGAGISSAAPV
jgi:myosin heavy subunit